MKYKIPSSKGKGFHIVDSLVLTCTCKAFQLRGVQCRHIKALLDAASEGDIPFEKDRSQCEAITPAVSCTGIDTKTQEGKAQYEKVERLSMTRLSKNFILRDFLYSTYAAVRGIDNLPEDWDMVIASGKSLCEKVLEPVLDKFGRFAITYAYQCREGIEYEDPKSRANKTSSNPHQWDRKTFKNHIYARVDILPFCVEDGSVSKEEFGNWLMDNCDIDLLMQWKATNVFCITISPFPRRVWLEWCSYGKGEGGSNKTTFRGEHYWCSIYPKLEPSQLPKFRPSESFGKMYWPSSVWAQL